MMTPDELTDLFPCTCITYWYIKSVTLSDHPQLVEECHVLVYQICYTVGSSTTGGRVSRIGISNLLHCRIIHNWWKSVTY